MNFFDLITDRHSIRSYTQQPIADEKFHQILAAINRAPSAGNLQAFEVYVIRDPERKASLVAAASGQEFLAQAPLVLVFCAHPARSADRYGKRGTSLYCIQDATIACTFAMLAAGALGLSTVWVGAFDEAAVQQIAGIPEGQRPIALLPVGYAGETPRIRTRRNLDDVIHAV